MDIPVPVKHSLLLLSYIALYHLDQRTLGIVCVSAGRWKTLVKGIYDTSKAGRLCFRIICKDGDRHCSLHCHHCADIPQISQLEGGKADLDSWFQRFGFTIALPIGLRMFWQKCVVDSGLANPRAAQKQRMGRLQYLLQGHTLSDPTSFQYVHYLTVVSDW